MNKLSTIFLTVAVISALHLSIASAGDTDEMSAEQWYRDSYAPLWKDPTKENMDAAMAHYTSTLNYHGADGERMAVETSEWMGEALKSWEEYGWVRSEMVELEATKINDSTYAFVSRWLDEYSELEASYSCGWYLVGKTGDGWRITTFADYACKD